jgi:hypothetical protein
MTLVAIGIIVGVLICLGLITYISARALGRLH